ncbi:MAG: protein-disulfide reductase DsbD N-terminal domain-containing protein, partial [Bacteroidales bacterium]|nr:protein-disulfide reductase DsbD N-terminal domain-containing protein [Bacteroidales bacterium]
MATWLLSLCFLAMGAANAQENPVKWKFTVEPVNEQEAVLVFSATVTGGYHLYAQQQDPLGPLPTEFIFAENAGYKLKGKAVESPKPVSEKDETFGVMVQFFKKDATFRQTVTLTEAKDLEIKGTIDYQVCNDETCLPFNDIPFSFSVKAADLKKAAAASAEDVTEVLAEVEKETEAVVEAVEAVVAEVAEEAAAEKAEG